MKRKKLKKMRGTELRQEEVVLSLERTFMSKERTVLTEISVLLGTAALGFIIIRLFMDTKLEWMETIGSLMVVAAFLGIGLAIYAYCKYSKKQKEIESKNYVVLK